MKLYQAGVCAVLLAACAAAQGAVGQALTFDPANVTPGAVRDMVVTYHENHALTGGYFGPDYYPHWQNLRDTIGDHSWRQTRPGGYATQQAVDICYSTDRAPGVPKIGLPNNGQIAKTAGGVDWNYQLNVAGFEDPAHRLVGDTPAPTKGAGNSLFVGAYGNQTSIGTIALAPSERNNYESINILFQSHRAAIGGVPITYNAAIIANYVGGTSATVWSNTGTNAAVGGSFGSASANVTDGAGGVQDGGWTWSGSWVPKDDHPDFEPGYVMTASHQERLAEMDVFGISQALWTFSAPIAVDGSKVLESLSFQVGVSGGTSHQNEVWVFGMSGVVVPEPTSLSLLGLAALGLRRMRRA